MEVHLVIFPKISKSWITFKPTIFKPQWRESNRTEILAPTSSYRFDHHFRTTLYLLYTASIQLLSIQDERLSCFVKNTYRKLTVKLINNIKLSFVLSWILGFVEILHLSTRILLESVRKSFFHSFIAKKTSAFRLCPSLSKTHVDIIFFWIAEAD